MLTSDKRRAQLRRLLQGKRCLRALEAHSPISALLAQHARFEPAPGQNVGYDAIWSSSLTDSTHKGLPDIEILSASNRLQNVHDIFEVSALPMIFDGDTGGKPEHFALHVRALERAGVSAVVIEDKRGLKKNSLLGNDVFQQQDAVEEFCDKIRAGREALLTDDFMIVARCESLILDQGMADAMRRCLAYVEAGAHGIMIHSRKKDGQEIIEFAQLFREYHRHVPLVCVPTSYAHLKFEELEGAGFNVVIYANHMLRSAYLAMKGVAEDILRNGRTLEVEPRCLGIDEILHLIPGTR
ncbi:phosphoenolpyruvate mutase [Azohydromonas caseinilytica]|uniref:phosphoenolpyruvate mutase n=1 Tax=Azohydromonas caseinilytica TaxID=2728836 RepID=A0A848FCS5_9BURK|nr:phosphoenolpyruvate mutase [Azohydromonas caseinilytica]NML16083.1 phosphoenolpyruvate mutase [Azohydromonas caseinilytica]